MTNLALVATGVAAAVVASACTSSDPAAVPGSDTSTYTGGETLVVSLAPAGATAVALGEPFKFAVSIRNDGPRSVSVPVRLGLQPPSGDGVAFWSTSLFVPAGEVVSEDESVTAAQWFDELGRFEVTVVTNESDEAEPLGFDVTAADVVIPEFEDVTVAAGVATTVPGAQCGQFSNGAAWSDIDADGDVDLVVTRLGDPVALFVNDGTGHFTEDAVAHGVDLGDANGASFADYDNDGDSDLMIVRDGSDRLYRNDGNGMFTDVSAAAGIGDDNRRGMNASWGDYDADGFVDLYVTNYMHCLGDWSTAEEIISQVAYDSDTLYHNEGDGSFSDATALLENDLADYDDGITIGAGFGAAWFDYNGDNRLDLYLANDFVGLSPDHNRMWRNDGLVDGAWKFTDVSLESGTALFMNAMGIGIGDVDRDGDADMALSNISANKLMRNANDGTFVEDPAPGMSRPNQQADYLSVTWGTMFYDLNLDGWEDLYLAAGNFQQGPDVKVGVQPNEVYLNDGSGQRFLDVSAATGADDHGDSKGVAFADYDADGDMDLFVVNQGGEPRLYRNVTPRGSSRWLEVDLEGTVSNRDACGALLTLVTSTGDQQRRVLCGSGAGGSASQATSHFGLGPTDTVDGLDIVWPSGIRQHVDVADLGQVLTIKEPAE